LPIQYAFSYPERWDSPSRRFDIGVAQTLRFEPVDMEAFPCLGVGFEVMRRGGTAGAALNGANEVAVERFLRGELSFLDIARLCRAVVEGHTFELNPTLGVLGRVDRWSREEAVRWTS
jgi:1-deoxy-D-xylulose-5-phosphate reductoisomerase